jgi:hypothetical protein
MKWPIFKETIMNRQCSLNLFTALFIGAIVAGAGSSASAAGLAEAFKEVNDEVRASIVKELIKSRAYDMEYTQRRPKEKGTSEKDDANLSDRERAQRGLDRLKDVMGEEEYDRPSRVTSCTMEIASQEKETGKPSPRRTVVTITKPIVQICK